MDNKENGKTQRQTKSRKPARPGRGGRESAKLRIIPLGGVSEIGKNMTATIL
jgi:mRNA degradation ribonuclease J1/J2